MVRSVLYRACLRLPLIAGKLIARLGRGTPRAREAAQMHLSRAWREIESSQWMPAIFLSAAAIEMDPSNAEAYLALGYSQFRSGNVSRARQTLARGEQLAPGNPFFPAYLADVAYESGNLTEAEDLIRRALDLRADEPRWLLRLAFVLHQQNRVDEADAVVERAYQIAPNQAEVLSMLGEVRGRAGDVENAERLFRGAIAAKPRFAEAHYNLARILADSGRLLDALVAAQRASALDPGSERYARLEQSISRSQAHPT